MFNLAVKHFEIGDHDKVVIWYICTISLVVINLKTLKNLKYSKVRIAMHIWLERLTVLLKVGERNADQLQLKSAGSLYHLTCSLKDWRQRLPAQPGWKFSEIFWSNVCLIDVLVCYQVCTASSTVMINRGRCW